MPETQISSEDLPKIYTPSILSGAIRTPAFRFEYKEFSWWTSAEQGDQIIWIPDVKLGLRLEYEPYIKISYRDIGQSFEDWKVSTSKNPKGVLYKMNPYESEVIFYLGESAQFVSIQFMLVDDIGGFSARGARERIIETFEEI